MDDESITKEVSRSCPTPVPIDDEDSFCPSIATGQSESPDRAAAGNGDTRVDARFLLSPLGLYLSMWRGLVATARAGVVRCVAHQ